MQNHSPERELNVEQALKIAKEEFIKIGLKYSLSTKKLDNNFFTTKFRMVERPINSYPDLYESNGKGRDRQSLASAMFEGLEHYYSGNYFLNLTSNSISKSMAIKNILAQDEKLRLERVLLDIFKEDENQQVKCLSFSRYTDSSHYDEQHIYYPAFLCHPLYNHKNTFYKHSIYSTNSGIAIGTTFEEALLHGICETIERDAFSLFLFRLLSEEMVHKVNINTIPNYLLDLVKHLEKLSGKEVRIFNITSEFNIPVYLSYIDCSPLPIFGCGCSIIPSYSLERSLTECVQSYHLHDINIINEDRLIKKIFDSSAKLQKAINFTHNSEISYNFVDCQVELKLKQLIDIIVNRIESKHYKIYFHIIKQIDNICCLKIIIPGLERFHLIRSGLCVLPGENILKRLKEGLNYDIYNRRAQ